MNRRPIVRAAQLAATAVLALGGLAACGSDDHSGMDHGSMGSMGSASPSASGGASEAAFDDADVTFAQMMIPHHRQALEMVALTEGRTLSPEVQAIVDGIERAQAPEVETMTGWLRSWGEDVPAEDGAGMSGMEGMDHSGMDHGSMPGMMTAQQMTDLEDASDADFQRLWLQMMIEHHRGAVEMAKAEQQDGRYAPARELADSIVRTQQDEIGRMQALLDS